MVVLKKEPPQYANNISHFSGVGKDRNGKRNTFYIRNETRFIQAVLF